MEKNLTEMGQDGGASYSMEKLGCSCPMGFKT